MISELRGLEAPEARRFAEEYKDETGRIMAGPEIDSRRAQIYRLLEQTSEKYGLELDLVGMVAGEIRSRIYSYHEMQPIGTGETMADEIEAYRDHVDQNGLNHHMEAVEAVIGNILPEFMPD